MGPPDRVLLKTGCCFFITVFVSVPFFLTVFAVSVFLDPFFLIFLVLLVNKIVSHFCDVYWIGILTI
jgi:hypothetical protein